MPAPRTRVAVVGPTATGKSDLALDIAEALGGRPAVEVVNADASQLYRGMDVGTAKLPLAERRGVIHHQLDVLEVSQEASVAAYQAAARSDLETIEAHGARGMVVGGSGLYVRAVTDDLVFPGTDPQVRACLERRAQAEGVEHLWEELRQVDPVSAQRIDPANLRKVVRALEVLQVTGRPFSATLPRHADLVPTVHLAIRLEREVLNTRIGLRARAMFEEGGLLTETRDLLDQGLRDGATASRAIGYAQAIAVIDGQMSQQEAIASTAQATRRLASRQIKWFRRDPRIHWLQPRTGADGRWLPGERQRLAEHACELVEGRDRQGPGLA